MNTAARSGLSAGIVTAAIVAASVLGIAAPAQAVAGNTSGSVGYVSVNSPQTHVTDFRTMYSWGPMDTRHFTTYGMSVYRSASSYGAQTVTAQYVLQKVVNGQWTNFLLSGRYSGTIPAGASSGINFPRYNFSPTQQSGGGYRIIYWIWWQSGGSTLASETVYPNSTADVKCQTVYLRCTAYSDGAVVS